MQRDNGRSPSAGLQGSICKAGHKWSLRQDRPHDLPLHADPAAMNDPQRFKTHPVRFNEIFLYDRLHIASRHAVQVENIRDWNADWLLVLFHCC